MRSPSLTRRSEHEGGRLCHWYDWRGRSVLVLSLIHISEPTRPY